MCIAVFVLNGFVSIASKLHQVETGFYKVSTTDLVLLGGILKFVLTGILYLLVRKRIEMKYEKKTEAMALTIIVASAAAGGISYSMQLFWGAASLPTSVLYPFITGGSIDASSLAGVIFFKERMSKNLIVSIVLCFIGTIMFL